MSALPYFFEKLLEQDKLSVPPTRAWDRFQKSKAAFVEDKAEEYFLRIFPRTSVYKNVIYDFNGNIEEADILIPHDNKLIIVQAKSGSLNSAARRGAEKAFINTVKKLVEDAYQQGVKVRNYVNSNPNASFKLRSTNYFAFAHNSKSSQVTDYIFINLTLEPLGRVSARIKDLRNIGLFKDNEYPISMSIYDLDIITSLLPQSPSIFMHYIKQRINAQNEGIFSFQDELTPFSWYLERGNLKTPIEAENEKVNYVSLDPDYLIKFDNYYLRNGEKPTLMIENEWIELIQHIENRETPGHTEITEHLLNIVPQMRSRIIERISDAFNEKYRKGVIGVTSVGLVSEPIGVSFVTKDTTTSDLNYFLETYCLARKYQAKKQYWIGLAKQQKSNGPWWKVTCIQYYKFPWRFDVDFESLPNPFSTNS